MPANGGSVTSSIRKALAESHIAAVAIGLLLYSSIQSGFIALWPPFSRAVDFLITAIAIRGVPYISPGFDFEDRVMVTESLSHSAYVLLGLVAAWILSRWIYGAGPFQTLRQYRARLARRNHVA